jgi:hypothetical protein
MTIFEKIPSIFDFVNKDSVRLSYVATPGQRVTAQAPIEINYDSDVLIEYK